MQTKNFIQGKKGVVRAAAILLLLVLFCQGALAGCGSAAGRGTAAEESGYTGPAARVTTPAELQADPATGTPAALDITAGDLFDAAALEAPFGAVFLNVGQADACLVFCGGQTLLIDGGNTEDSRFLVACLKKLGVSRLDYVVCSHAHEDHVGGLAGPLNVWPAGRILAPAAAADSQAYRNFLKAAAKQDISIEHPEAGDGFTLGDARVEILGPGEDFGEDLNNTSLVLRIVYGQTSFLFTGDVERAAELGLLEAGVDLEATVLKVAHHGSDSSTSYIFLRQVMPSYAIISVAEDNAYGHPHEEVLSRLADAGAAVLRTDRQGSVLALSDGKAVRFIVEEGKELPLISAGNQTEKGAGSGKENEEDWSAEAYIGNKNSQIFHRPDCANLPAEKNQVFFHTREEALSAGYRSCENCSP